MLVKKLQSIIIPITIFWVISFKTGDESLAIIIENRSKGYHPTATELRNMDTLQGKQLCHFHPFSPFSMVFNSDKKEFAPLKAKKLPQCKLTPLWKSFTALKSKKEVKKVISLGKMEQNMVVFQRPLIN